MVEQLLDRVAEDGDLGDDDRTRHEEGEEETPQGKGLHDPAARPLARPGVPPSKVERTRREGTDRPDRRQREGCHVEDLVARLDPQGPGEDDGTDEEGDRGDHPAATERPVRLAVVTWHRVDEGGTDEGSELEDRVHRAAAVTSHPCGHLRPRRGRPP